MWRDLSHVFDETSTNGMFEEIFESMMEEHDGCDVEEYELMVEQFNLFAGRVAPTPVGRAADQCSSLGAPEPSSRPR